MGDRGDLAQVQVGDRHAEHPREGRVDPQQPPVGLAVAGDHGDRAGRIVEGRPEALLGQGQLGDDGLELDVDDHVSRRRSRIDRNRFLSMAQATFDRRDRSMTARHDPRQTITPRPKGGRWAAARSASTLTISLNFNQIDARLTHGYPSALLPLSIT